MKRTIIRIDEDLCNGCGLCVSACHEGAIRLVDGKARLVSDRYCDGLGNCLPECPTGAITLEDREADPYDEAAVQARLAGQQEVPHEEMKEPGTEPGTETPSDWRPGSQAPSRLAQWPVQLRLVAPDAPFLEGAHLLLAADCAAFARGFFHEDFMKGRITLIGCPKLDDTDYSERLAEILRRNDIRSLTVVRMQVPCCGGLVHAVKQAMAVSGRVVPWSVTTLRADGSIVM